MSDADRWGSQLLGAAMTAYGLSRWRRGGWILAGFGVLLFRRGFTGHCHTYDLIGVSSRDLKGPSPAPAPPTYANRSADHIS